MAGPVPGPVAAAAGRPAHRGGPGETRAKEHEMTSSAGGSGRILGGLRSADGKGVVRMEDRFSTDIDDLWSDRRPTPMRTTPLPAAGRRPPRMRPLPPA